jgi:hypothetical protein
LDVAEENSAIWSLQRFPALLEDDEYLALDSGRPVVTIEVVLAKNELVQAPGRANRVPSSKEWAFIRRWPLANDVTVAVQSS